MKVTSMIATTSLKIDKEYEVISEVKALKSTFYKIEAETGEEMFINSNNFIKVKDDE